MKLLALAFALTVTAFSQSSADVDKAEDAFVAAVKARDAAALDKLLAADLVYTHSSGVVDDKAAYLAKMKSGEQIYTGIEYSNKKVRLFGRAAVLTATVRMTGSTKGVPFDNKLLVTRVWARSGGRGSGDWQLVAHQTTRLP